MEDTNRAASIMPYGLVRLLHHADEFHAAMQATLTNFSICLLSIEAFSVYLLQQFLQFIATLDHLVRCIQIGMLIFARRVGLKRS